MCRVYELLTRFSAGIVYLMYKLFEEVSKLAYIRSTARNLCMHTPLINPLQQISVTFERRTACTISRELARSVPVITA